MRGGSKPKTTENFVEKSKQIHGDIYDYSASVYTRRSNKIKIICKRHGMFEQFSGSHLEGHGCKLCSIRKVAEKKVLNNSFIESAKKLHGDKYDYSKVKCRGAKNKVTIVCEEHGEYRQRPSGHLQGSGCPECKKETFRKKYTLTAEDFIKKSTEVHGDKYDYRDSIYKNNVDKIKIICKIHGKFEQNAHNHFLGQGCPKCRHRVSKPEMAFLDYAKICEKNRQKYIGGYWVDGIRGNTIYEFLGDWWHGNPDKYKDLDIHPLIKKTYKKIREQTFCRLKYLKDCGYNIKYVWESDWNKYKRGKTNSPKIQQI